MYVHFQNVHSQLQKMAFLKIFKCIKSSKEERIESVLAKSDGLLVHLMPSSAIEAANSAIREFLPMALSMKTVPLLAIR